MLVGGSPANRECEFWAMGAPEIGGYVGYLKPSGLGAGGWPGPIVGSPAAAEEAGPIVGSPAAAEEAGPIAGNPATVGRCHPTDMIGGKSPEQYTIYSRFK